MVKQNDKQCIPVMQRVGCFVRSCGAIAEFKTEKRLTVQQVNDLWIWAKRHGYITDDNCVKQSAPIANRALEVLGDKGKFVEVATFRDGVFYWYPSVNYATRDLPKSYIQKIRTRSVYGTHFRVVDGKGCVKFDPYTPDVKPKSIEYSIVYVYVEAK